MKEFYENDNNHVTDNQNDSVNETRTNDTTMRANDNPAQTGTDDINNTPVGDIRTTDAEKAASETISGTNQNNGTANPTPIANPYLNGTNTNTGSTNAQNPYQNVQNPYTQNAQPQNQNPYSPYTQNAQQSQNPYGTQQNQNPYGQYQQYQPHRNEISYTPVQNAPQKTRKAKNGKAGFVALAVVGGILLSTGFGFIGSAIGNHYFVPEQNYTEKTGEDPVSEEKTPAVIYKSVDTVSTSTTADGGDLTSAQVAALVKDSVVEINTEFTTVSLWYQYVSGGAGSGVIISEDGYVITNNHVICGNDGTTIAEKITVRLTDGSEYPASVIGTDVDADIAIIKIDKTGLTPAIMGNSDTLSVGEDVIAVGNPLGELGGSVTNGIISALDREISVNGVEMNLLQTNAAVNPGNSGGGLFNMRGELIGVVNAKSSGNGVEGLGFAIPVNDALNVAEQLMEYGYVKGKVVIGIVLVDITDASMARYLGLSGYGTYITEVTEGYNDDVLQVGDRIISVNGEEISSREDVTAIVKKASVGDKLNFQVSRQGKMVEVEVTCYEKVPESVDADLPITRG